MNVITLLTLFAVNVEIPAKISYLEGTVTITRAGIQYAGLLNTPLYTNDIVTSADNSKCEIQFSNYSLIRLEPNSSIKIERKEKTDKGIFQSIFATIGEMVTKVTKLGRDDEYEIRTDVAQAFIRGTTFKTAVAKDGTTAFSVFEGKLKVKGLVEGAKEILLDKNFGTRLSKGQLKPIVKKLSLVEIQTFRDKFKEFIERGEILEELRHKIEEEKDRLEEKGKKKLRGCLF